MGQKRPHNLTPVNNADFMQAIYLAQKRGTTVSAAPPTADQRVVPSTAAARSRPAHAKKPPRFGPSLSTTPSVLPRAGSKQVYLKAYDLAFYGEAHHSAQDTKSKYSTATEPSEPTNVSWRVSLPTAADLYKHGFGKPDVFHSVTQEGCFETSCFFLVKDHLGYLDGASIVNLFSAHPLIRHTARMCHELREYDFRWVRESRQDWASLDPFSPDRIKALLAALFHYNNDVGLLMRWLGGNYTGSYRNVAAMVERIRPHVDASLIPHLIRVLTVGCPHHFNAETTRANALKYWRYGNNPSVAKRLDTAMSRLTTEARNHYVIPLPSWVWRFVPHLFVSPMHILVKPGKKARSIHDLSFRMDADAIPINMMTSTPQGTEFPCRFGDVLVRLLTRIYNLRITYPTDDIALHASDVKSCFRQIKHAPDVMGAFSFIINGILFLQCGQSFGADFSPPNWEIPRLVIEQLATSLFSDNSLRDKHRKYLDMLSWDPLLGRNRRGFTPAKADNINRGVRSASGRDSNTPHDLFVDDDVYADVYNIDRIRLEQAIASGIEAVLTVLGASDLQERQDPVAWDKLVEMVVSYTNCILGMEINTRRLTFRVPRTYVQDTATLIRQHWHEQRQSFTILDIEILTGRLGHIATSATWLSFLMSQVYSSVAHSLKAEHKHQICTNANFRQLIKDIKRLRDPTEAKSAQESAADVRRASFAHSKAATIVHRSKTKYFIGKLLRRELSLIKQALDSPWISFEQPIGHAIDRAPSGKARSDSSLSAAGGYSFDMKFWWHIVWPPEVQRQTLRFITTIRAENGDLISINVLEYAAIIITVAAATHFFTVREPRPDDPFPVVLYEADSSTAESWAVKACKSSLIGRALGRLHCCLLINNPVGTLIGHVASKDNIIADRLSRATTNATLSSEFHSLLQDFPQLHSCRRFQPSQELLSLITEALLSANSLDPLEASRRVLTNLGKITMSDLHS